MDPIFKKYTEKRVYKSLAQAEFFDDRVDKDHRLELLDDVFETSEYYDQALARLSNILNKDGHDAFRFRYAKYKSANKSRDNKVPINISREMNELLSKARIRLGCDTYDETLERLLDRTDEQVAADLVGIQVMSFEGLRQGLSFEAQKLLDNHIENLVIKAFRAGVDSVPTDLRKKGKLERTSAEALEMFLQSHTSKNE